MGCVYVVWPRELGGEGPGWTAGWGGGPTEALGGPRGSMGKHRKFDARGHARLGQTCTSRKTKRKGSPRNNLARKLAGNIAVARDSFFPPASVSGHFQQKMSAEYDWVRKARPLSTPRELAVETHQKH